MNQLTRLACILLVTMPESPAVAGDTSNIFLITHSEIEINADSSVVWPYILDTSEWKTIAEKSHHAGEPDKLGEVELVRGESGGAPYQFFVETVELTPEKRKVLAIYFDEAGKGDIGYAAWTLFPQAGGTLVTYDVYSVNRIPGITADQVNAVREQVTAPNRIRLNEELHRLKTMIEKQ